MIELKKYRRRGRRKIKEIKEKANTRLKGNRTNAAALCFLSDIVMIAYAATVSVIGCLGKLKNIPLYINLICAFGDFKRRYFIKILTNAEPKSEKKGIGYYILKYFSVFISSLFIFLPAIVLNVSLVKSETEGLSAKESIKISRPEMKKILAATLRESYKALILAVAVAGIVNLSYIITVVALKAVIVAISVAVVAAAAEYFYSGYKAMLMLYFIEN